MRKTRTRQDTTFFPAVSNTGYKIELPGPRQQFTFRYRYTDCYGVFETAQDVLNRCDVIDAKTEADKAEYERVKLSVRAHYREQREKDRARNTRKRTSDFYGDCAYMSDIVAAYNERRNCDIWD